MADPASTLAPGAGSCETMIEAGDGLVGIKGPGALSSGGGEPASDGGDAAIAIVTCPTENPASCSVFVTVPSGWPTKLGTTKPAGGSVCATRILTFGEETFVEL